MFILTTPFRIASADLRERRTAAAVEDEVERSARTEACGDGVAELVGREKVGNLRRGLRCSATQLPVRAPGLEELLDLGR
jgi:hypothetical protein